MDRERAAWVTTLEAFAAAPRCDRIPPHVEAVPSSALLAEGKPAGAKYQALPT